MNVNKLFSLVIILFLATGLTGSAGLDVVSYTMRSVVADDEKVTVYVCVENNGDEAVRVPLYKKTKQGFIPVLRNLHIYRYEIDSIGEIPREIGGKGSNQSSTQRQKTARLAPDAQIIYAIQVIPFEGRKGSGKQFSRVELSFPYVADIPVQTLTFLRKQEKKK